MARKDKKKRKKKGGLVAGTGIVVLAGLLIGFDPFGLGLGAGFGLGEGSGILNQQGDNQENPDQKEQPENTQAPETTEAPKETETPEPTSEAQQGGEITLKEVLVEVNARKLVYNGAEVESAQKFAELIATEYADELANVLVKIKLTDAVYDTVEELKATLEGKNIVYQIME